MCLVDPCMTEKCDTGFTCVSSYCGGCNHRCVRDETKPPAPTPTPKCDDATEPLECKNENECYNVAECKCGPYPLVRCLQNPCNMVKCSSGYVCEDTYCGGCHARCVEQKTKPPAPTSAPTPVPETLPFCALQGPTCGRFSPRCKRGYACLADPTCDRETEKCDRCCCALPQCKPGYRLRRRRSECRDKAAERGLCYEVKNSCGSFVCQKPRRWN
eukprot:TRINITY_DN189_c0_g1_i13.p1 TRINITY_DN189_c0_g1~~TRINITY_DN189_c0_g1_i13.p1  ORF type:complete len:215 (+),score=69.12 TRINITY_DN189_c0_g1_i13:1310-1954(+)